MKPKQDYIFVQPYGETEIDLSCVDESMEIENNSCDLVCANIFETSKW